MCQSLRCLYNSPQCLLSRDHLCPHSCTECPQTVRLFHIICSKFDKSLHQKCRHLVPMEYPQDFQHLRGQHKYHPFLWLIQTQLNNNYFLTLRLTQTYVWRPPNGLNIKHRTERLIISVIKLINRFGKNPKLSSIWKVCHSFQYINDLLNWFLYQLVIRSDNNGSETALGGEKLC